MKRFTETTKWNDPWFRRLKPSAKLLFFWMLDNCDSAGVIDVDFELASFQIGCPVTEELLTDMDDRVVTLGNGKRYIYKFVQFQYGEISRDCKAHSPVFKSIEANNLTTYFEANQRVSKGYPKGIQRVQDKEKDKDTHEDFDAFWQAYPKKVGKGDALKSWNKAKPNLQDVLRSLDWQKQQQAWLKDGGQYIPNPSTYLNQQRWLDEAPASSNEVSRLVRSSCL